MAKIIYIKELLLGGIILILVSILFFIVIIAVVIGGEKQKNIENILLEFVEFDKDYVQITSNYITTHDVEKFKKEYEEKVKLIANFHYKNEKLDEITFNYNEIINNFSYLNDIYVDKILVEKKKYFDNIYGISLDEQQRKAIVVDDLNNIIIAGAGSGKTLTIAAKIKYLIEIKKVDPKEILCISFTNASVQALKEKNQQYDVDITTFHRLGLKILKEQVDNIYIADEHLLTITISSFFNEHITKNEKLINDVVQFFAYYINPLVDMNDYDNLGEYYEQEKGIDLVTFKEKSIRINNVLEKNVEKSLNEMKKNKQTLRGEIVKSKEELIIANYLFINGINYEYEMQYKNTKEQYKPDFYLVDYDIYFEHFGINRKNKLPWLSEIEEVKYLNSMKSKRELHKEKGTKLIETYSYNFKEGQIFEKLDYLLKENNIIKNPVSSEELLKVITDYDKSSQFNEFKKLISTFINLYKSYNIDETNFDKLKLEVNKTKYENDRSILFLRIVKEIYLLYEKNLKKEAQIDFHDMINNSIKALKDEQYEFNYKYIIIDEFQDTSMVKTDLVKKLIEISNAKLIVVGDDWQSIYRFAGSDSSIFKNFEEIFGKSQLLKIENTYRNSQQLLNVASDFIMKNKAQISKELKSNKRLEKPVRIVEYSNESNMSEKFEIIINKIYEHNKTENIFVLLRNKHDINTILDHKKFTRNKNFLIYNPNKEIKIIISTVHASKGLESENVIILGLENRIAAFPNKIVDDPLLGLIKLDKDEYLYAEERRLFYVALTRTKKYVYLFTSYNNSSTFVNEIRENENVQIILSDNLNIEDINCPKCIKGKLVVRDGNENTKFLGCTNYPKCDANFSKKNMQSILKYNIVCPKCGGFLIERTGVNGMFFGCSNYPDCKCTLDFNEAKVINH